MKIMNSMGKLCTQVFKFIWVHVHLNKVNCRVTTFLIKKKTVYMNKGDKREALPWGLHETQHKLSILIGVGMLKHECILIWTCICVFLFI